MAYDPIRDAAGFRATLKRLADVEHLTSQAIVDLFNARRVRGETMSISRATLDRFVGGEDITRIRELRVIHDLLRSEPAYRSYFEEPAPVTGAADATSFVRAFGAFLAPDGQNGDSVRISDMVTSLPGQFVLMRLDHDPISVEQGVRISSVILTTADGGVAIEELQSYRTPDYDMPFEQTDKGFLFTHGPRIFFLMKELGGTAVKFGVIEQTLPEIERRQPVQYFQGYLMVVSRRGVFPRTRFAARRFSPNQHPMTSGILRLAEIADPRAVEHLRLDYAEGGLAQPA